MSTAPTTADAAPGDVTATLAAVDAATARLVSTARGLDDAAVRRPSLLPGWSLGHVLTHVARNADALVNLLTWARTGDERPMYPSRAERDAAIDAGAVRPAAALADDVDESAQRFAAAAAALRPGQWAARVRNGQGREVPAAVVPWMRLREVEIHHVDLGTGLTPAGWPPEFAERMLEETVADFAGRSDVPALTLRDDDTGRRWTVREGGPEVGGPEQALLAWLIGRASGDGLTVSPPGPLPPLPAWK